MQKWMGLFLKQNLFCFCFFEEMMLGLSFSSKFNCGSYTVCPAKIAFKKMGHLIHYIKFLPPDAALYFYKATI